MIIPIQFGRGILASLRHRESSNHLGPSCAWLALIRPGQSDDPGPQIRPAHGRQIPCNERLWTRPFPTPLPIRQKPNQHRRGMQFVAPSLSGAPSLDRAMPGEALNLQKSSACHSPRWGRNHAQRHINWRIPRASE